MALAGMPLVGIMAGVAVGVAAGAARGTVPAATIGDAAGTIGVLLPPVL